MILICLWPYAMRHANDVANATPRKGEEQSPLEWFSGVNVMPKMLRGCSSWHDPSGTQIEVWKAFGDVWFVVLDKSLLMVCLCLERTVVRGVPQ